MPTAPATRPIRLLLLNPNTAASMTDLLLRVGSEVASAGTSLITRTASFGAAHIGSRVTAAIAGHAALDTWAACEEPHDAVILGCFGDPGLAALRELSPVAVVGLAEASCLAAIELGARFAIVTGGRGWVPMLEEFVASIGLSSRLARVRSVTMTGADIARDPDSSLASLAEAAAACAREDGADVVILGGAGLAGLASRLADRSPVPLVDCVVAAIRRAEALARLDMASPHRGDAAPAPVRTSGLSPGLARRLERPDHTDG